MKPDNQHESSTLSLMQEVYILAESQISRAWVSSIEMRVSGLRRHRQVLFDEKGSRSEAMPDVQVRYTVMLFDDEGDVYETDETYMSPSEAYFSANPENFLYLSPEDAAAAVLKTFKPMRDGKAD